MFDRTTACLACMWGLLAAAPCIAQICVECHRELTPGIVNDWQLSAHAANEVGCANCHGDEHTTREDVDKVRIPTPETCAMCHRDQFDQFSKGKHAHAWTVMKAMPTTHRQPMAMIEGMKGCGGCHKIGLKTEDEIAELKKDRRRIRRGVVRRMPYASLVLARRSPPAASLPDLPHGL